MCRKAISLGLTGIALTEHDLWCPEGEFRKLQAKFPDLIVLRGVEYVCLKDEFLVFLPEPNYGTDLRFRNISELISRVHDLGGIVIWAHPFRYDRSIPEWLQYANLDGMEVDSSNMDIKAKCLALEVARDRGYKVFQNSDAHIVDTLGRYYNDIPVLLKNVNQLIRYIKLNI
jgi:histidinol phosphatase-like PHP family hydrolase